MGTGDSSRLRSKTRDLLDTLSEAHHVNDHAVNELSKSLKVIYGLCNQVSDSDDDGDGDSDPVFVRVASSA